MPNQASMKKNEASSPSEGKIEEEKIFSQTDLNNQAPSNVGKIETEEKEDKEASFKVISQFFSFFYYWVKLF